MIQNKTELLVFLIVCCGLLLSGGCGKDQIIDVNTLPCGTARGNIASGNFTIEGVIEDDNCLEKDFPGPFWIYLFCGVTDSTVQQAIVNHYEPGVRGCETGRLEIFCSSGSAEISDYTLAGGIWSDGSFRVGRAVAALGYTYRILMDGKFSALDDGGEPHDHFSGRARVDVEYQDINCTYYVQFTGERIIP